MQNALMFNPHPRETAQRIFQEMGGVEPAFFNHSSMVAECAILLGNALRLPALRLSRLEEAAWLHDVLLSDATVSPTELHEREDFQMHPVLGAEALRRHGVSEPVCQIVQQHHERWDGEGFPGGLAGEGILLEARIIALADGFSHLGPYMFSPAFPGWAPMATRLVEGAGTIWDPFLVAVFLNACRKQPCNPTCAGLKKVRLSEILAELQGAELHACAC